MEVFYHLPSILGGCEHKSKIKIKDVLCFMLELILLKRLVYVV